MGRTNGFILLEVLVSLVILGTVIVVSLQTISSSVRVVSATAGVTTAAAACQQMLTRIALNQVPTGTTSGTIDDERTRYIWTIAKSMLSDSAAQYDVSILWKEQGRDKELAFITGKHEFTP